MDQESRGYNLFERLNKNSMKIGILLPVSGCAGTGD